jgi:bifunctional non-homologous end joining protein LigD
MKAAKASPTAPPETLTFGATQVSITHPDRVLFPADGITKAELVHYYRDVARFMLPYVEHRPLTLQRFPEGIDGFSFFEKKAPKGLPDWVATTEQPRADGAGKVNYPMANDARALAWFANLASIAFHVWISRVESIRSPDYLLFDLDPFEGCTVRTLAEVAIGLRDELHAVGLETVVKTTGGKGLHVLAPLAPGYSYEDGRAMNEIVAHRMRARLPAAVTLERTKAKRAEGTVYFDWAQLGLGRTMVAPFSVRPRPSAPVSTPITWSEVEAMTSDRSKHPTAVTFARWNLKNVPPLLAQAGDPWKGRMKHGQALEPALEQARAKWSGRAEA